MNTSKVINNKDHLRNILFLIVLGVVFLALLITTIVLTLDKKDPGLGQITTSDLDSYQIYYSRDVQNAFKLSYRAYLKNWVADEYDTYLDYLNLDQLGAASILLSFENAQISADKVEAISRYLNAVDQPQEFLTNLISKIARPVLDDSGEPVLDDSGEPVFETDATLEVFSLIIYNIGVPQFVEEIIYQTGLTAFEFGKFVFELSLLTLAEESNEKALLIEMGRNNFAYLFSDIANSYIALQEITNSSTISYADGRVLRETFYEQGARLDDFLNSFGSNKLESLLGIGTALIDIADYEQFGLTNREAISINGISESLEGSTEFLLRVLTDVLVTLPSSTFDSLVDYITNYSSIDSLYSSLSTIKTIKACIEKSFEASDFSSIDIANKFATVLAYMDVLENDEELFNQTLFIEKKTKESYLILELYALMTSITDDYSHITSTDDLNKLDTENLNNLQLSLTRFSELIQRPTKGIETAFTVIFFGMFVRLVNGAPQES
ncbi:MAG: hypothetical protein LBF12_02370 [Christensenellaceae bacterium]|nr:hypothetical protein [Christensenellaceae bacterium]